MTLRFNLRWNVEFEMNSVASLFYTHLTSILFICYSTFKMTDLVIKY